MTCLCSGIFFADVACWPISHLPMEGELVTTEKIELSLGGHAANVSVGLSRLGVPVTTAGCVGDDGLSDFILNAVSVPGVDLSRVQRSPGRCPGTAMHINVRGQDRRFICTTGANDDFTLDDSLFEFIKSAPKSDRKVFYLGGFFMLRSLENSRTVDFLKSAQANGWTTMIDVVLNGPRPYGELIEPLLPYTDIFLPNEHEGEKICDHRDPYDQAKAFLDAGVKTTIITQGENGTLCFGEKEQFRAGIFPADYVSGSGSGDAFSAGMIAAILEGLELRDVVRWGSAMGASAVHGVSTTETVFTRSELLEFLDRQELVIEPV